MIDLEKAKKVLKALEDKKLTLSAVESFTGGLFSSTICAVPGASKVFKGALVTYSAEVKSALDNVPSEKIREYGVVSKEIADLMAINGRKVLKSDISVSFTGNAGPTKENGSAPVGRVYMSIATKFGVVGIAHDFNATRNQIREFSVDMMLDRLIAIFEN